ncbi:MAG: hypothetical protein ACR2N2_07675 [Acidimicrobiia bacterium]
MNGLILFSVIDIVILIGALAVYLYIVGGQLTRVATVLEECSDLVDEVRQNAEVIEPGLVGINNTGRVIAGALPLLYGMAEGVVDGATFDHDEAVKRPDPARGRRRSRQLEGVGYDPD